MIYGTIVYGRSPVPSRGKLASFEFMDLFDSFGILRVL